MKRAIVTGASGFVGKALCKRLSENGIEVTAIIRKRNVEFFEEIDNLKIIICEMADYDLLAKKIGDVKADIIYHLAWEGNSGALRGNYRIQLSNVIYSCNLIEICNDIGCKKIVFPASIMEYELAKMLETESDIGINSLYSTAKMTTDSMMRILSAKYGISYIRPVISNIYGPGENSPRLINSTIRKLLKKEHCSFSSGQQMYDFIYIDDAVEMLILVGDRGIKNRTYYIGSGKPRPLKDFLVEMGDLVAPDEELGIGEITNNGVSLNYNEFDLDAVKKDIGYVPKEDFRSGILKTMRWIKENEC